MATRSLLLSLVLLASNAIAQGIESVSISDDIPRGGHTCVSKCVYYTILDDIGVALDCGAPYDNRCYCNTASTAATAASRHISNCVSAGCQAGDLEQDWSSAHMLYASYCINAGYTQPGATEWYDPEATSQDPGSDDSDDGTSPPAPSQTEGSLPPQTVTQISVVTETIPSRADPTQSRDIVTVEFTSTVWMYPDGTRATGPPDGSSGGGNGLSWKIGVGVGVPVAALIIFVVGWFCIRRRRNARNTAVQEHPPVEYIQTYPTDKSSSTPASITPISRNPVASPAVSSTSGPNEMAGDCPGPRRELQGEIVQHVPINAPALDTVSPMSPRRDEYEVQGGSRWTEVSGEARPPELGANNYHGYPTDNYGVQMERPGNEQRC